MPKKQIWDNPIRDSFFEERWKERALEEGSKIQEVTAGDQDKGLNQESDIEKNQQLDIYLEMIEAIGDNEELLKYLAELENSVVRYYASIKSLAEKRRALDDQQEMEDADWARKRAHNAVVDNLSIFSRAYVKNKGVNHWRIKIDGGHGDRERIANWVKAVAPFIQKKWQSQNPEL
jgi:hypothetical protein